MKNNLQTNPLLFKAIILVTCFMLVMLYNKSQGETIYRIAAAKVNVSFKQNIEKHEIIVTVKTRPVNNLQLFLFDTDGKLVKQLTISNQKNTKIKDLKKGTYIYDCFDKNTRVNFGVLTVND